MCKTQSLHTVHSDAQCDIDHACYANPYELPKSTRVVILLCLCIPECLENRVCLKDLFGEQVCVHTKLGGGGFMQRTTGRTTVMPSSYGTVQAMHLRVCVVRGRFWGGCMIGCGHAPVHVDDIVVSIVGEGRGLGWVVVGPASSPVEDSLLYRLLSLPFLPLYLLLRFSCTRWEVASAKRVVAV